MEESDLLSADFSSNGGIPAVVILIITKPPIRGVRKEALPWSDSHDLVAELRELNWETANDVTESSRLRPRGHLGGNEDEVQTSSRTQSVASNGANADGSLNSAAE